MAKSPFATHAEAKHIVCAWNIPSSELHSNGSCDDGDYGVSQHIAQLLSKDSIQCRAIFVVRNCGQKLNEERIRCYVKAAINTLLKFQFNKVTNKNQLLQTTDVDVLIEARKPTTYSSITAKAATPTSSKLPHNAGNQRKSQYSKRWPRNRGRGRGRGGNSSHTRKREEDKDKMDIEVYSPPTEEQLVNPAPFHFSTPWEASQAAANAGEREDVD